MLTIRLMTRGEEKGGKGFRGEGRKKAQVKT